MHAGEEGVAPRRAALLSIVGQELCALFPDSIDVGRLTDCEFFVVNARLHPADVVAHDEKDVGLIRLRECSRCELRRHEWHGDKGCDSNKCSGKTSHNRPPSGAEKNRLVEESDRAQTARRAIIG